MVIAEHEDGGEETDIAGDRREVAECGQRVMIARAAPGGLGGGNADMFGALEVALAEPVCRPYHYREILYARVHFPRTMGAAGQRQAGNG